MQNLKPAKGVTNLPTLPPADLSFKESKVNDAMWFPHVQKQVEQAGEGYEKLKGQHKRMGHRVENGASAQFSDEEFSDDDGP